MNHNIKGFTLVELLAVIVILTIISLITLPIISKVITRQQKNTFEINVQSMVKVAKTDWYDKERTTGYYKYENNELVYYNNDKAVDKLKIDGKLDGGSGIIKVKDYDTFIYSINNSDWCAIYSGTGDEEINEFDGECGL